MVHERLGAGLPTGALSALVLVAVLIGGGLVLRGGIPGLFGEWPGDAGDRVVVYGDERPGEDRAPETPAATQANPLPSGPPPGSGPSASSPAGTPAPGSDPLPTPGPPDPFPPPPPDDPALGPLVGDTAGSVVEVATDTVTGVGSTLGDVVQTLLGLVRSHGSQEDPDVVHPDGGEQRSPPEPGSEPPEPPKLPE